MKPRVADIATDQGSSMGVKRQYNIGDRVRVARSFHGLTQYLEGTVEFGATIGGKVYYSVKCANVTLPRTADEIIPLHNKDRTKMNDPGTCQSQLLSEIYQLILRNEPFFFVSAANVVALDVVNGYIKQLRIRYLNKGRTIPNEQLDVLLDLKDQIKAWQELNPQHVGIVHHQSHEENKVINVGPTVVTLCGSTRFMDDFIRANKEETIAGKIVLSVGFYAHQEVAPIPQQVKEALDRLHFQKIDYSHEILVIDKSVLECPACQKRLFSWDDIEEQYDDGVLVTIESKCCHKEAVKKPYIGESTRNEIAHAKKKNKKIRYRSQEKGEF
jgi:hypothetical protein